ncbi:DUF4192 family protein [Corynebacterium sp. AOP40-9SA-29]|uniref:DUF4192 family protein n=1 Tax=Corynebacterium sp. AOP40-9SA-29 TaxID=3457677 RepID=UPI004033B1DE
MTSTHHNTPRTRDIPARSGTKNAPVVIDGGPGGLIGAVPALLGFTPTESIVIVGLSSHGDQLESLGPVVRTDLVEGAAQAGAQALARSLYDMPGASAMVIVTTPYSWPLTSAVVDVLSGAVLTLADAAVEINAMFVTDGITAGARWRQVEPTDSTVGWHVVREGTVDDPAAGPVVASGCSTVRDPRGTSESMDRELDPDEDEDLAALLPNSWTSGVPATSDGGPWTSADVCEMIAQIAGRVDRWMPVGRQRVTLSRQEVRRMLREQPGTAESLFEFCTRGSLFPTLVALGAAGQSGVVLGILLEAATLGRGSLRGRALLLIAFLGWCGNHGALGHRAAKRCTQEMWSEGGVSPAPELTIGADSLRNDLLTLSLAGILWDGVGDGTAARLVNGVVGQGMDRIDAAIARVRGQDIARAGRIAAVVDRQAVSAVRSALGRRAGK